jgi:WD40 repeat protein
MFRRSFLFTTLGLALLTLTACNGNGGTTQVDDKDQVPDEPAKPIGNLLYAAVPVKDESHAERRRGIDPIIVPDCHLTTFEKEDVPAQKDGAITFIATEIKAGEIVPKDLLIEVEIGKDKKTLRRLREGDFVEQDQLMAMLDDRMARAEVASKDAKVIVAQQEFKAAEKTRDEAKARWDTQNRLRGGGRGNATSEEDLRAAKLLWDKSTFEAESKRASITVAERELEQAKTSLYYHEIRAKIPGIIKTIYKTPGEAVKNLEPVFQIRNLTNLRVEGTMDYQYFSRLSKSGNVRKNVKAMIEPSEPCSPVRKLIGHLQEINSVAVGRNKEKSLVVSASEDGTVRIWDPLTASEYRILHLPRTTGRSVACTGPGAKANWLLVGCGDGVARLWDLDDLKDEPAGEFKDKHNGAVNCVAFSPDGDTCATGGDDRQICLWDPANGKLRYSIAAAHKGGVTSLQFTTQCQLVSAGRDTSLQVWTLGDQAARREKTNFNQRSGDVAQIGVSPDGQRVLFDQGKTLKVLTLKDGANEGFLQNGSGVPNFSSFALFSPDGALILTASGSEGRVQLWRRPAGGSLRGYELRQLVPDKKTAITCAAFTPDGKFIVTGTKTQQVLIWDVPVQKEIEEQIAANLTLVEQYVESANQVRVHAYLPNPGRILPGSTVTLVIDPGEYSRE